MEWTETLALSLTARVPAAGVTSGVAAVAAHVGGVTSKLGVVVSRVSAVAVSRMVAVHGSGGGGKLVLVRRRLPGSSHRPSSNAIPIYFIFRFF